MHLALVEALLSRGGSSSLADSRVSLTDHIALPDVLACDELSESIYDIRMWMSASGNTTSSQHFDAHENLMLQARGCSVLSGSVE